MYLVLDRYSIIRQEVEDNDCWIILGVGKDNELYSLSTNERFVLGEEKVSNKKIECGRYKTHSSWYFDDGYEQCAHNGFLTYAFENDALDAAKHYPNKVVVAHCIIPVNANYIMGEISTHLKPLGYISDRICLDKICQV